MIKYADNSFVSCSGDGEHQLYSSKVMPDGKVKLFQAGKEDFHAMIQSFKESTDISYILAKLAAGDNSVLRPGATFGDFTNVPNNYAELLQLQIDTNRLYDSLPVDVKKQFDNDVNKFFASAGTEDWYKKMSSVLPQDVIDKVFPKEIIEGPIDLITPVVPDPVEV